MGFFGLLFWLLVFWLAYRIFVGRAGCAMTSSRGWPGTGYSRASKVEDSRSNDVYETRGAGSVNQQAYIDALETRVSELEERLDFTERLVAGRKEAASQS